jgi:branched-chain amino acid transport system permease protein
MELIPAMQKRTVVSGLITLAVFILLATSPQWTSAYTPVLLSSIIMYLIITMSWTIFSGPTGYISLAPAAFFGIGIYFTALFGQSFPFPVVILMAGMIAFIVAILVGALTLRLKGVYFVVFTFGLVELIQYIVLFYEINFTGTRGRFVMSLDYTVVFYYMLAILFVLIIVAYLIRASKFGLALTSIGEEEEASAHCGVNVTRIKVVTFAISAFFMGSCGAVMATKWTYIDPGIAFNPDFSFLPVLMAIFGGLGHFFGPLLGAAIFTYLEEYLITRLPELYKLIFGAVLIISILYLPNGVVGLLQAIYGRVFGRQQK